MSIHISVFMSMPRYVLSAICEQVSCLFSCLMSNEGEGSRTAPLISWTFRVGNLFGGLFFCMVEEAEVDIIFLICRETYRIKYQILRSLISIFVLDV